MTEWTSGSMIFNESGVTSAPLSAQEKTYRWLRRQIAEFPHDAGFFMTEAQIARELGVSRTPVREALLRLEAEGMLKILPKKGAYVAAISSDEAKSVMEARRMVEEWCVRIGAVSDHGLGGILAEFVEEQKRLAGDPVAFIECDREFHSALVRASRNPLLENFYESLRDRQVRMGLKALAVENRVDTVVREHQDIAKAVIARDEGAAVAAVKRHLDSTWSILASQYR